MDTTSPLCHEALLTLARKVESAAMDGDRDRVESAARRLLTALIDHTGAEWVALTLLSPEKAREFASRQHRLVDDLVELAADARDGDLRRCKGLARQLIADLTMLAEDERRRGFASTTP